VRGTTAAEQAEYLFQNMKATLESLGSGLEDVIKTTIYLTDARHADGYREGRKKYLPHAPPSTLIMGVQLAEPEMLIEIEAVAVISEKK
jgi:2-iminobutanoate/2-iminopropanoate deaminase